MGPCFRRISNFFIDKLCFVGTTNKILENSNLMGKNLFVRQVDEHSYVITEGTESGFSFNMNNYHHEINQGITLMMMNNDNSLSRITWESKIVCLFYQFRRAWEQGIKDMNDALNKWRSMVNHKSSADWICGMWLNEVMTWLQFLWTINSQQILRILSTLKGQDDVKYLKLLDIFYELPDPRLGDKDWSVMECKDKLVYEIAQQFLIEQRNAKDRDLVSFYE
ncbi:MAG: hypothetical protein GY714_24760 [Desulfobacterales bacterium]|nr:hypothetical protein [Desulfobacterales bacterium]